MKQTVEMFTIKCDNCGKLFEDEYNGYSCWGDENDAWENASEVNWIEADFDTHYCPDCYSYDDNDNLIVKKIPPNEEKKEIKPTIEAHEEESKGGSFEIFIDQNSIKVKEPYITGSQIKVYANVPANYGVWLKGYGKENDKEISNNEQVDLNQPYRDIFFTGSKAITEG